MMAYVSDGTLKKKKELDAYEATKPGEYQSQYQDTISNLLDQIVNRKDFSYDFNADPLYQQYKDNYIQQGKQAMMNTMANAATLTGGYGNSYATSAGAQANQQYLQGLNDVIPELYNAALDKYNMDTDNLVNQYSVTTDAEDRDYSRYADSLANWQVNRDYLYSQYMDLVAQDQYQEQLAYQQAQDAQAYQQWLTEFNYQQALDALVKQQASTKSSSSNSASVKNTEESVKKEGGSILNSLTSAINGLTSNIAEKRPESATSSSTLANIEKLASEAGSEEKAADIIADAVNSGQISINEADRIYMNIMTR